MCLGGGSNSAPAQPQQPQQPQYEDAPDLFTTDANGGMVPVKRRVQPKQPSMLSGEGGGFGPGGSI